MARLGAAARRVEETGVTLEVVPGLAAGRPFLKWAGGKRQLLPSLLQNELKLGWLKPLHEGIPELAALAGGEVEADPMRATAELRTIHSSAEIVRKLDARPSGHRRAGVF
jgi:hypothetical protein